MIHIVHVARAKNKAIRVQKKFKNKYNMYAVFSMLKTAVSVMSCCRIQRVIFQFFFTDFLLQQKKPCVEGGYYELDENIGDQSKIERIKANKICSVLYKTVF